MVLLSSRRDVITSVFSIKKKATHTEAVDILDAHDSDCPINLSVWPILREKKRNAAIKRRGCFEELVPQLILNQLNQIDFASV